MDLVEISKKLDKTHDNLIRLEGQVDTLTKMVGFYQTQVSKLEGRQWAALMAGFGGLVTAVIGFVLGKH